MLSQITPLVLTFNEVPNIARTLDRLAWARDVVVVDSGSTDGTLDMLKRYSNVRVVARRFTTHAEQWGFALKQAEIRTEWVLALDADYVLSDEIVAEIGALRPVAGVGGFQASFVYCIEGEPLRSSVYPPVVVLYRRTGARYVQDGHTQRVVVDGKIRALNAKIFHDDRKPVPDWIAAQLRYMDLEAHKILQTPVSRLAFADKVRRLILPAAPAMLLYCLFVRGGVFDGRAGLFYALQRTVAELILSLYLLRTALRSRVPGDTAS